MSGVCEGARRLAGTSAGIASFIAWLRTMAISAAASSTLTAGLAAGLTAGSPVALAAGAAGGGAWPRADAAKNVPARSSAAAAFKTRSPALEFFRSA